MYRVLWGELRLYIGMFFGARHSCRGLVIWLGFGMFRCFSLFLSLPLLLLLLCSGGRPGCFSSSSLRPAAGHRTDIRYWDRPGSVLPCLSFFLFLPGSVASLLFSLRLPSLSLSFSLSLSLFCKHALSEPSAPASCHTLVSQTKPCISQSSRFTARRQMAHYCSNFFFAVLNHTWIIVEYLGLIRVTCLTFGECL